MANKNDLRFIKTEQLIRSTFTELKREKKGGHVSVTEVCKAAMINNSTFYSHYETIEYLQEDICRKAVEELMENEPRMDLLYCDTAAFINGLVDMFKTSGRDVIPLFPGWQSMVDVIEKIILERYCSEETSQEESMKLKFCIGGALRLVGVFPTSQPTIDAAIRFTEKVLQ